MLGKKGYGDCSTPYAWLSSITWLPWLPGFSPQALPTTISSVTFPQSISPQSTAALAQELLHNPWTPSPSRCTFQGNVSLSGVCMAAARTVWFSFHLGFHRSAVSLSALNVSPLTQTIAPMWGSDPCFSSLTCRGQVQSYSRYFSPKFLPPTEFCVGLHILFHWWGTPVCSQLMFCMYFCVWRCIPDVFMERDALHVHLLLCHLVLSLQPL